MPIHYETLTLAQIADDLVDTLCDLATNAGQRRFEPLLEALDVEINPELKPSDCLVKTMNELLEYDSDQLKPEALQLMKQATDEILRINSLQI